MIDRWKRYVVGAACLAMLLSLQEAQAAWRDGAWSAEGRGWTLRQRNQIGKSAPLRTTQSLPHHATITTLYWRYHLITPYPSGLKIALCSNTRCVDLPGGQGVSSAFAGDSANTAFTFSLTLPGKGAITPPVRMLQSQLIVNYRYMTTGTD